MGVSQYWGYFFGGPYNKDYSILGSILGSPILGNYMSRFTESIMNLNLGCEVDSREYVVIEDRFITQLPVGERECELCHKMAVEGHPLNPYP